VNDALKAEYVEDVSSWDSGGGTILDLVTLKSGKVIAISEEVVVLYDNMEDLEAGESRNRPSILL
jgi:hypothetical protein